MNYLMAVDLSSSHTKNIGFHLIPQFSSELGDNLVTADTISNLRPIYKTKQNLVNNHNYTRTIENYKLQCHSFLLTNLNLHTHMCM